MEPVEAAFEITSACNLSCIHCYNASEKPSIGELTTTEIFNTIDQLKGLGTSKLKIGGGEPLLRKDLPKIMAYAIDNGFETSFSTNSLLLNQNIIRSLCDAGMTKIQVSLDGTRHVHDNFRQKKGLFNKVIDSIQMLNEHDIDINIASTITKFNMHNLPNLYTYLNALDIKRWRIMKYIPCGRGTEKLMPSPEEYRSINEHFYNLKRSSTTPEIVIAREFDCNQAKDYNDMLCTGARTTFSIRPNGDISPCSYIDDIVAGNIRQQPLSDILNNSTMKEFAKYPDDPGCGYWNACKGGCKAIRYSLKKQSGCDPYCWINSSASSL